MSELLTVAEVAKILDISADSVTRKFSKVKGVVDIGSSETMRKRRYRVLRIPVSVVEKYLRERGGAVSITAPERTLRKERERRDKGRLLTDGELAQHLARVGKQRVDRIVERARLLRYIPEDRWREAAWFDEGDD